MFFKLNFFFLGFLGCIFRVFQLEVSEDIKRWSNICKPFSFGQIWLSQVVLAVPSSRSKLKREILKQRRAWPTYIARLEIKRNSISDCFQELNGNSFWLKMTLRVKNQSQKIIPFTTQNYLIFILLVCLQQYH